VKTKTVIIGHSSNKNKLAFHLEREAEVACNRVVTVGRSQVDFDQPTWPGTLSLYLGTEGPTNVILNLFDHRQGHGRTQEKIFDYLWQKLSLTTNVQIIVIGSLAHYWPGLPGISAEYVEAKRSLHKKVTETYKDVNTYRCKLLYVELGVLESMVETKPTWPCRFFKNYEAAQTIIDLSAVNNKTMFVGLTGSHSYVPQIPQVA
jgi:hypothetical protein